MEQCGLRLVIPGEVITPIESIYEVAAQGVWSAGKFVFPEGSTLINGVCYILISSLSERESYTEMMLKLSGFPADSVMTAGWRVQPLHIPPLVSEQCNVIIKIIMIFILFIDQQKRC